MLTVICATRRGPRRALPPSGQPKGPRSGRRLDPEVLAHPFGWSPGGVRHCGGVDAVADTTPVRAPHASGCRDEHMPQRVCDPLDLFAGGYEALVALPVRAGVRPIHPR